MARKIDRLSARGVASASEGLHADGGGLYLKVESTGARRWTFIFRFRGKRCELGLGSANDISLAAVRETALQARAQVRAGTSPIEERRRQRAAQSLETFGALADQLIADLSPQWKSAVHKRQWETTMRVDAAQLRPKLCGAITTDDVLQTLKPIWLVKPETASRVRGRIERVLDAAKVKGFRDGDNPARWRGHLELLLPARPHLTRGHHPALPYEDLPAFMRDLRQVQGISAKALELTILTAVRTDPTRFAHGREFDLVKAVWTVPAARLKRLCDHRVPLCPRALEIVRERIEAAGDDGFLFPGQKHGNRKNPMISNMAMANLLPHLGHDNITVHGFRSTFKDWALDCTLFPNELSEVALHHTVGDAVEQSYRRGDGLKMRVQMMDGWARYCDGETNVIVLPEGFSGRPSNLLAG